MVPKIFSSFSNKLHSLEMYSQQAVTKNFDDQLYYLIFGTHHTY